jgi:hypothetical protein
MLKKYYSTYGGIIIGGLYGLLMRIIFGINFPDGFADLFSITFIFILPIIVGLTPLLFAPNEDLHSLRIRVYRPVMAVLAFFIFYYWSGREDIICILIISIPFLFVAGTIGLIVGDFVLQYRKRKGIVYTLFFIPIIAGLIEPTIPTPSSKYETTSSTIINADKTEIWNNIVRVNKIRENEYEKGFFNHAGIPRPLYAELDKDTLGGSRIGHFEGGLQFQENIIAWTKDSVVTFDIKIIPSTSNRTIFERHMLQPSTIINQSNSIKLDHKIPTRHKNQFLWRILGPSIVDRLSG